MQRKQNRKPLATYEFMPSIVVQVEAQSLSEAEEALRREMIGWELEGRIAFYLGSGTPVDTNQGNGPMGVGTLGGAR